MFSEYMARLCDFMLTTAPWSTHLISCNCFNACCVSTIRDKRKWYVVILSWAHGTLDKDTMLRLGHIIKFQKHLLLHKTWVKIYSWFKYLLHLYTDLCSSRKYIHKHNMWNCYHWTGKFTYRVPLMRLSPAAQTTSGFLCYLNWINQQFVLYNTKVLVSNWSYCITDLYGCSFSLLLFLFAKMQFCVFRLMLCSIWP
jgi:hypothetical protein